MTKQPKPFNQKSSQKFCQSLKLISVDSFKEMAKVLQIRERNSNNAECRSKLQQLLSAHPELGRQLNEYLEESVRMPIQSSFVNKIEELFAYVKSKNYEHINIIIDVLKKFGKEMSSGEGVQTKQSEQKLKRKFLELFKDDEDTHNKARDILYDNDTKDRQVPEPQKSRRGDADYLQDHKYRNNKREPRTVAKEFKQLPLRNPVPEVKSSPDDMEFILKLDKCWPPAKYSSVAKVIFLFEHCIISLNEASDMIPADIFEDSADYDAFRDMIESRELSRRRMSNPFKPLNDTDFSNSIRATFSYVQMPWCYPILCKGKSKELRTILNDKWVSVPHGSEHSNFFIRIKNQFQQLLLKSEDERYQFDIYSYRLKICQKLFDKITSQPDINQEQASKFLHHIIGMNVIQTIYKNTTKEQKEDLERQLKHNLVNTCAALKQRVTNQISALETIRNVHAIKAWMDVAEKNFVKSLDRKCSEFKKNQKENTKPQFYEAEVEQKLRYLKRKEKPNIFQESASVFSVFNSFESYSVIQRCESHKITPTEIPNYRLEESSHPNLLPVLMFLFQNKQASTLTYSLVVYYLNNYISNEAERSRLKKTASKFFQKVLNFEYLSMSLPEAFKEEEFYQFMSKQKITDDMINVPILKLPEQPGIPLFDQPKNPQTPPGAKNRLNVDDRPSDQSAFNPVKDQNSSVWFFSFNMYTVLRLIYTLYQRVLKALEILYNYKDTRSLAGPVGNLKLGLFKILFMLCVKSKENSKFEENLGELFGPEAYLFSTIYKLLQTFSKVLQSVSGDLFSVKLLDTLTSDSSVTNNETLYLTLVNRLTISHPNSDSLFRIHKNHLNQLVCVNYFKSSYKSWDQVKDKKLEEKLQETQRGMDIYVSSPGFDPDAKNKAKKKEKKVNKGESSNRMQYFCLSSGLRLFSSIQVEDYYAPPLKRQLYGNKLIRKEIKRAVKTQEFLDSIKQSLDTQS